MAILFNKPYRVLSQFSASGEKLTLAAYVQVPGVYPAGRLDYESEGLMILTADGKLQARIADPRFGKQKTYLVQVDGQIDAEGLQKLRAGVLLKDGMTLPAEAQAINAPALWERNPPVRYRKHIPTSWLELKIREGRNRQVRRMTAAVGFPTLRLVRAAIGPLSLGELQPGCWTEIPDQDVLAALSS